MVLKLGQDHPRYEQVSELYGDGYDDEDLIPFVPAQDVVLGAPKAGDIALYTWGTLALGCIAFLTASAFDEDAPGPQLTTIARTAPNLSPAPDRIISQRGGIDRPKLVAGGDNVDPMTVATASPVQRNSKADIKLAAMELPEPLPIPANRTLAPRTSVIVGSVGNHGAQLQAPGGQPIPVAVFARLSARAPDLLGRLTAQNVNGQLIAGPFPTPASVAQFCRSMTLRLTLGCRPVEWGTK